MRISAIGGVHAGWARRGHQAELIADNMESGLPLSAALILPI